MSSFRHSPAIPRRRILSRLVLLASLTCIGVWMGTTGPTRTHADEPAAKKTVKLVIDFGDGFAKQYSALDWKENMTVLDVMNQSKRHPRGIRFEYQGSGETGLLLMIDDLKNEGRGRNWIYRVNEKLGDRSFAIYPVAAGDVVLWKFSEYK